MAKHNPDFSSDDEDLGLLDALIVLAKHKRFITLFVALFALCAAGVSFLLPVTYQASTQLLPPQQAQSTSAAILAQFSGMAGLAAGVGGLKNPNDLYVGMLKSRTIADRLISKQDLKQVYEMDELERTRKKLAERTTINSGKDGLITIEVEDTSAQRAAGLANGYVEELLHLTRVLAVTEASQRRMFFEQQLERAKNNLANAEVAIKSALDSHGVISIDSESRAVVETTARLRARISGKEIELNAMKAFVTTSHPQYLQVNQEIISLRSELDKLENGRPNSADSQAPANAETKSGFQNIKLLRDLKYHQMLYELLAKQYEAARLDEAKNPSVIQVLDPALVPEKRFKPKRAIFVITSTAIGFVLAILIAFAIELKQRAMREPKLAGQWAALKAALRS